MGHVRLLDTTCQNHRAERQQTWRLPLPTRLEAAASACPRHRNRKHRPGASCISRMKTFARNIGETSDDSRREFMNPWPNPCASASKEVCFPQSSRTFVDYIAFTGVLNKV